MHFERKTLPMMNRFTLFLEAVSVLVAVSSVLVASQDNGTITYYIKPSHTSTCPHGPCMTLSEFSSQGEELIQQKVRLEFLAGTHFLYDRIVLNNSTAVISIRRFSMSGDGSTLPQLKSVITCSGTNDMGFSFIDIATVEIKFLSFFSCRNTLSSFMKVHRCGLQMDSVSFQNNTLVTAISLLQSFMTASNCSFTDNTNHNIESAQRGVVLVSYGSKMWFNGSNAFVRNTGGGHGGCIALYESWLTMVTSDGQPAYYTEFADSYIASIKMDAQIFISNLIRRNGGVDCEGGVLMAYLSRVELSGRLYFIDNATPLSEKAGEDSNSNRGGCIFALNSTTIIRGNGVFRGNKADSGGAIFISVGKISITGEFEYTENTAGSFGGAIRVFLAEFLSRERSIYSDNVANFGGALVLAQNRATLKGDYVIQNGRAVVGAGIHIYNTIMNVHGGITIHSCNLKNAFSGVFYVLNSVLRINGTLNITRNHLGLYAQDSNMDINGHFVLDRNYREMMFGAGIRANNTRFQISGKSTITSNVGTPLVLYNSLLVLSGLVTLARNSDELFSGGMFLLLSSVILYDVEMNVSRNSGRDGGAFHISGGSTLGLKGSVELCIQENRAQRGGGIFVQDVISFQVCAPKITNYLTIYAHPQPCFLRVNEEDLDKQNVSFENNFASEGGTDLYGGMLESCFMSDLNETGRGLNIFTSMSSFTKSNTSAIASDPFGICFCENRSLNCDLSTTVFNVQRGQTFSISLAATGQANGIVPTTVRAQFKETDYQHTGLAPNQASQQSGLQCQTFNYTVFSAEDFVELTMYADGPCRDLGNSSRSVQVNLLECSVGFQLSQGNCICHPQIQHFTTHACLRLGR